MLPKNLWNKSFEVRIKSTKIKHLENQVIYETTMELPNKEVVETSCPL